MFSLQGHCHQGESRIYHTGKLVYPPLTQLYSASHLSRALYALQTDVTELFTGPAVVHSKDTAWNARRRGNLNP